jgi:hypothetical protein
MDVFQGLSLAHCIMVDVPAETQDRRDQWSNRRGLITFDYRSVGNSESFRPWPARPFETPLAPKAMTAATTTPSAISENRRKAL